MFSIYLIIIILLLLLLIYRIIYVYKNKFQLYFDASYATGKLTPESYNYPSCIPTCLTDDNRLLPNNLYNSGRLCYIPNSYLPTGYLDNSISSTDLSHINDFSSCNTQTDTRILSIQVSKIKISLYTGYLNKIAVYFLDKLINFEKSPESSDIGWLGAALPRYIFDTNRIESGSWRGDLIGQPVGKQFVDVTKIVIAENTADHFYLSYLEGAILTVYGPSNNTLLSIRIGLPSSSSFKDASSFLNFTNPRGEPFRVMDIPLPLS